MEDRYVHDRTDEQDDAATGVADSFARRSIRDFRRGGV